ncbi:MAG: acetylxylan esterase [Anaerolineae bacterium]|nr:acetylxylan esterase [Anaerolineae bacterium]
MAFFDLSLEELQAYQPPREEPPDFDAFWAETLAAARQHPLNARFEAVDFGLRLMDTYDVTFAGYGGQPIKGWFMLPRGVRGPLPCVVEYIGYGGGRGFPHEWLTFAAAGFAYLIMDTRGQGGSWRQGDTSDVSDGANPHTPGFMTQGILDPRSYYYRRLYTDAVRAIEAARSHPAVDPARVVATGISQGGGLAVAVSGLVPDLAVTMPNVPFLCHFRRAIGLTADHPYQEIVRYLSVHRDKVETVFRTLSYFDGMSFAARSQARALYSTALMDMICPPSTVFAAYNYVTAPKEMRVYQFNNHEGGGGHHTLEQIHYLHALWG